MKTKNIIFTALFAALTCVATMIIKLPTPTMGYIHPGDAIVLLSGLLLGPWYGSFAAGLAAGRQRDSHGRGQGQCKQFFHFFPSFRSSDFCLSPRFRA